MSVPAAAGYPQLKNQGVIMTVYSRMVNVKYYAETCLPKITNSKFEGEIKDKGDKVIISQRPDIVTKPYKKGMTLDVQVPEAPPIEMPVDRARYFCFQIDNIDEHQAHIVLQDEYLDDGNQRMAIDTETEFFSTIYADAHAKNAGASAGVQTSAYDLGVAGTPLAINTGNAVQNLTKVKAVLGEQNAVSGKLWIVIPWWYRYLLMNSDLKNASLTGDERSVQRTAALGEIDGTQLYVSNLLTYVAADTAHHIVFGNSDAVCFAAQMTKADQAKIERGFGMLFKGLHVYDWKTLKPEGIGHMYAKLSALAILIGSLAFGVPAQAATFTNAVGGPNGYPYNASMKTFVIPNSLDLSNTNYSALASNDVIQVVNIPSNTLVMGVSYRIRTMATNACTFDIGDGTDPDGWGANISATNAVGTFAYSTPVITASGVGPTSAVVVTVVTTPAYGLGKAYTVADTIDVTIDTTVSTLGVIDFEVIAAKLNEF